MLEVSAQQEPIREPSKWQDVLWRRGNVASSLCRGQEKRTMRETDVQIGNRGLIMKINWKDVLKFLSGAFFVTAGASWYLSWYHVSVPFFGLTMTPKFLELRGFLHFALFLISSYFGFVKK
jgi:hypothetical protein